MFRLNMGGGKEENFTRDTPKACVATEIAKKTKTTDNARTGSGSISDVRVHPWFASYNSFNLDLPTLPAFANGRAYLLAS